MGTVNITYSARDGTKQSRQIIKKSTGVKVYDNEDAAEVHQAGRDLGSNVNRSRHEISYETYQGYTLLQHL